MLGIMSRHRIGSRNYLFFAFTKTMNFRLVCALIALSLPATVTVVSAQKTSRQEYINRYKNIVLEQQDIYGIPASVKMAQALLESDNGNSRLATEGNNHFGIKCKKDWRGETINHDDDAPQECFRKYNSAEESFKDHSEFLDKSERYQGLFKLDPMDYKGWAYGLKAAGYATNPKYPELLIKIIEDNKLYLLDQGRELPEQPTEETPVIAKTEETPADLGEVAEKVDVDNYIVSLTTYKGYTLYSNNGSEFVVAGQGDTFSSLSGKLGISVKKLRKFNDMPEGEPTTGSMIYIKSKGKRSNNGKLMHYVKDGETLHSISQMYGIRIKYLYNMNRLSNNTTLTVGQQIRLM